MNVYDSARMEDALLEAGFEAAGSPEGADMVVLNTCHIREKAAEKVYSELGRLRQLQAEKKAFYDENQKLRNQLSAPRIALPKFLAFLKTN